MLEPAHYVTFALLVPMPLFAALSGLLIVKYRRSVKPFTLAFFIVFFSMPFLSLAANCFLYFGRPVPYLAFYLAGEAARTAGLPFVAYCAIRKKPAKAAAVAYVVFALVFVLSAVPEQALQNALIAQIRTAARYGLLWGFSLAALTRLRRVADRFDRFLVAGYGLFSLFSIPFVAVGLAARLRSPATFADEFFSYSQGVFNVYLNFCGIHILLAFLMLFRRRTGDVDLPRFAGAYALSDREKDIVELMLAGFSNPAIGEKLFISPHTVRNHSHRIFRKCGVKSRYEMIALLRSQGFSPPPATKSAGRACRKRDITS